MGARRIWSETVPYDRLKEPRTLALLRRFSVEVLIAVRPWDVPNLADLCRAYHAEAVPVALWPMLADKDGRWVNVHNASKIESFLRQILDALEPHALLPNEIVLDLEPSMLVARALLDRRENVAGLAAMFRSGSESRSFEKGRSVIARSMTTLEDRGIARTAALAPLVLLDPPGRDPWQRLLGTPVDDLPWSRVSVMLYTSIIEGWSRGAMRRRHALELLERTCVSARARFGARAGVSLGAVGAGAFGDEPIYREPRELAEDVSIALSAGVTDIALLDLGGVLARPPAEAWLAALVETDAINASPRNALRLRAANLFEKIGTRGLGRLLTRK